jgi:hypothetical protein
MDWIYCGHYHLDIYCGNGCIIFTAEKYQAQILSIFACTWLFFIPEKPGNGCILSAVANKAYQIFSSFENLADLVPEIPKNQNSANEKLGKYFFGKPDLIL